MLSDPTTRDRRVNILAEIFAFLLERRAQRENEERQEVVKNA